MQHSSTEGQNVEAKLNFLLSLHICNIETLIVDELLDDAPVEPRKTQLDVEACMTSAPGLHVVNVVDFL